MSEKAPNLERWKNLVVFLTIVTTVIAALVAGLQADASIRANQANRDSQLYAIQISGELERGGLKSNYELGVFAAAIKDRLEATVLELTALQLEDQGDRRGAAATRLRAEVAQARAAQEEAASVLYADPRYAPDSPEGMPDFERYLADSQSTALELLAKQNAAADEYNRWNKKGDGYAAVLTVLTIALFLLGLAQALSPRLRLLFAVLGVLATGAASLWALLTLIV